MTSASVLSLKLQEASEQSETSEPSQLLTVVSNNKHLFSLSFRVSNLELAYLGDSGSGFLLRWL